MNVLEILREYACAFPQRAAVRCGAVSLSYRELWEFSDALAAWLIQREGEERHPVAVYGHKHPWMLICFLACVKSGRAYCPIDCSVPDARTESILQMLPSGIVLTTEALRANAGEKEVLELAQLQAIVREQRAETMGTGQEPMRAAVRGSSQEDGKDLEPYWVKGDETWYIIFTSGSTGTPKGVQISADCLKYYLDWSVGLGSAPEEKRGKVFLNQAPFSFDLSVMDLYTSLVSGGTLYCLEKNVQSDYRLLIQAFRESGAGVWVSTPSFAEVCLSDRTFDHTLLPELTVFLFCGETLANRTVKRLQQRFPNAVIVNTYGPTESTVAVTEVAVSPELASLEEPLPTGRVKEGTRIEIWDADGTVLPDGEKGEIVLIGNTVSTGYYRQPELTGRAFFRTEDGTRGYRTGDCGYLKDGMLHYCGRIDLQIKLHGYRIELEDIENNIRRLPGIVHAAVLPNLRAGRVSSLTAYVVLQHPPEDRNAEAAALRQSLLQYVPAYMVPKKLVFLDQMPMTANGKADRKRLEALRAEAGGSRT